jgi:protein-disulfide isomerase
MASATMPSASKNAKVTLIEYGDYQCPYCKQYYPVVKQVAKEYKDKVQFQFRNFPLAFAHPHAMGAAQTAEAAAGQGKFWEMHDLLYEKQDEWAKSDAAGNDFVRYAAKLNLNMKKFRQDYASKEVNNIIRADEAEARRLKLPQTPAFLLNGKEVSPDATIQSFRKLLDTALQQKS